MQKLRSGEHKVIPFRNERYFCANGLWYFEVRGGEQRGPYTDKGEMKGELSMYIREQTLLNQTFTQRR